jgi:hypothetical protein
VDAQFEVFVRHSKNGATKGRFQTLNPASYQLPEQYLSAPSHTIEDMIGQKSQNYRQKGLPRAIATHG